MRKKTRVDPPNELEVWPLNEKTLIFQLYNCSCTCNFPFFHFISEILRLCFYFSMENDALNFISGSPKNTLSRIKWPFLTFNVESISWGASMKNILTWKAENIQHLVGSLVSSSIHQKFSKNIVITHKILNSRYRLKSI